MADIDPKRVDIWLAPCRRPWSAAAAMSQGSRSLVDYLKLAAPGMVYSVGMPARRRSPR